MKSGPDGPLFRLTNLLTLHEIRRKTAGLKNLGGEEW
jgi:hypothetical protein